jgi:hypothetical protein
MVPGITRTVAPGNITAIASQTSRSGGGGGGGIIPYETEMQRWKEAAAKGFNDHHEFMPNIKC